ncbi:MAG: DNA-directed DNA polymerase [Nanoarchaeota archaeon]|nr:DNA-directed DNA polymerase [Nanoarchaeota archaeon]MBU1632216.1 DNA-directed DNA polymerase [Nanoarchaeota archaeon]MBU1875522.1 DNA-directed DNA polymerase [Nanoarchaeota archaeon]
MEICFYPYEFDYKVENGKPYVYLYGKLDGELNDGQIVCVKHHYEPYFYAFVESVDKVKLKERLDKLSIETDSEPAKVLKFEEVEKELIGKKKSFWKIYTNYPKAVPPISRELRSWGVECYENDILFVHRYLRDKKITPMTLVKAKGEFLQNQRMRVPVFMAEEVMQESQEALKEWKTLAIDIETYATKSEINLNKNPVLMVAFYGKDKDKEFKKVITWKNFDNKLDYLEVVKDEVDLLERCKEVILSYKPEIITGYFSDGFDFPYLKARADKYKVRFDLGLDYSELISGNSANFRTSESKIKGILHLDIFKFIKNIFGKNLDAENFSLDAISNELLGHKKHEVNLENLGNVWDNEPEKLEDYCEYNLHDSHLTSELCNKLLPDMIEFSKIIGLPTSDIIRMRFSRLVENYILKRSIEFNVLAPNKPSNIEIKQRKEESIQGAFVFEPTPGLYENIIIFDFRSLYPTIITAHNIGPEGFKCSCCKDEIHVPEKEDYWFCTKEKKFIPSVLERLILRRADLKRFIEEAKQKGENTKILEARSYALKVLANSFYGYLGFYGARWYCLECAASTTAYARDYIKKTIQKAKKKGFEVIYADTDSCFLLLGDKIMDEAMEFMNEINFDLPGYMELEYEGHFPKGIFVAQKGSEKGAKKKYALLSKSGNVKITGFESVRRNWSELAKEIQKKVLNLVLLDNVAEAIQYVKDVVADLKKGKISLNKLILKTQLTRDLSYYTSIGPHVKVARELVAKGEEVLPGTIIEYVIVKGSGLVRERARIPTDVSEGNYDPEYYINNQLIPAVSSIFAVLGYSEEEIFHKSSQIGLGKFF